MPSIDDDDIPTPREDDDSDGDELHDVNDEEFRITLRRTKDDFLARAVAVTIPQQEEDPPPTEALVQQFGPAMGLQISQILTKMRVDESMIEPAWRTTESIIPPRETLRRSTPPSIRPGKNSSMCLLERGSIWSEARRPSRRRKSTDGQSKLPRRQPSSVGEAELHAFGRDPFDSDGSIYSKSATLPQLHSASTLHIPIADGAISEGSASIASPPTAAARVETSSTGSLPRLTRAQVKRLDRPWVSEESASGNSSIRGSICNRSYCGHNFSVEIIAEAERSGTGDSDRIPAVSTNARTTPTPTMANSPVTIPRNDATSQNRPSPASAPPTTAKSSNIGDSPPQQPPLSPILRTLLRVRGQEAPQVTAEQIIPDIQADQGADAASRSHPMQSDSPHTTVRTPHPRVSDQKQPKSRPAPTPMRDFAEQLESRLSLLSTPVSGPTPRGAEGSRHRRRETNRRKSTSAVLDVRRSSRDQTPTRPRPTPRLENIGLLRKPSPIPSRSGSIQRCGELGSACERAFCLRCL